MRRIAEKLRSAVADATGSVKAVNRKPSGSADITRCLFVGRRTTGWKHNHLFLRKTNCSDCRNFSTSFEHLPVSCRRSDWRTLLTSTLTLNCFTGQLDQFSVYHSHMKGNTEITNCHHKHYVSHKKTENVQKSGAATNWEACPPLAPAQNRACSGCTTWWWSLVLDCGIRQFCEFSTNSRSCWWILTKRFWGVRCVSSKKIDFGADPDSWSWNF